MIQTIHIDALRCETIIGVYAKERAAPQPIILSACIEYDTGQACASDRVEDTLDYYELAKALKHLIESSRVQLLERLLALVLKHIASLPRARACEVRLAKPEALRPFGAEVSLSGHWQRG